MALPFLDGSVIAQATSNASLPVSLTTTNTNDIIVVSVTADFPPTSVSSPTLGSFTHLVQGGSIPDLIDVWVAFSSGALSSETITVTPNTNTGRIGVVAFGVTGTNQTSLTGAFETSVSGSYPLSITTTDPTTFVCGFTEPGSGVSFSPGTGWTQIQSDIRSFAQYQTVSPAATVTSTNNFGFGGANVNIAIIQTSGGATPSFTFAVTEAADTAAFTTSFADKFALSVTETADTAAFTTTFADKFSFAVTEAADTAAFTATFADQFALSTTEAADTAAFTTTFADQFALSVTEAPDVAAFNLGSVGSFTLAATESADTAAFTTTFADQFAFAVTEAPDVAAFVGDDPNALALAATEAKDTAAFTTTFADQFALAATESVDTAAFTATVSDQLSLATTEASDVAAFTATFSGIPTFALATTEAPDVAAFVLGVVNPIIVDTGYGGRRHTDWETKRTKRERLEDERLERDREKRKAAFKTLVTDAVKPPEPKKATPAPKAIPAAVKTEAKEKLSPSLEIAKLQETAAKARTVAAEIMAKSNTVEIKKKAVATAERVKAEKAEKARVEAIETARRVQRAYDDALAVVLLTSM